MSWACSRSRPCSAPAHNANAGFIPHLTGALLSRLRFYNILPSPPHHYQPCYSPTKSHWVPSTHFTLARPMAGPSPSKPDIANLAAPILFGPLINWSLYGLLCVQIYVYSYSFPSDRRGVKLLAYFVFLLETAQTVLTGTDVYYWFIEGFGDAERLKNSHFAPVDIAIIDSIISLIVQEYFCYRIWTLSRQSWGLCILIAVVCGPPLFPECRPP
ncbi:hypothetical protein BC826DRAFT_586295 [Russula brevipes]|nr:hypothetical protein BC826DRAFT_586295 [Russula brevipes]